MHHCALGQPKDIEGHFVLHCIYPIHNTVPQLSVQFSCQNCCLFVSRVRLFYASCLTDVSLFAEFPRVIPPSSELSCGGVPLGGWTLIPWRIETGLFYFTNPTPSHLSQNCYISHNRKMEGHHPAPTRVSTKIELTTDFSWRQLPAFAIWNFTSLSPYSCFL